MLTRRVSITIAALAIAGAAAPATASAKGGFSAGVASAEITQDSARLWTRAPRAGALRLEVARDKRLRRDLDRVRLTARRSRDLTVQAEVR